MHKLLFLLCFLSTGSSLTNANFNFNSSLTACPNINSSIKSNIEKLVGKWYLAIILFDEDIEALEDENVCIKADFQYSNETFLNQEWSFEPTSNNGGMTINMPTTIEDTSHWTALSPLGVPVHVTVLHVIHKSRMVLMFCADHHTGGVAHLWTAMLTRKKKLSHLDLVHMSAQLLELGFDPNSRQLITWHHC
ncbi:uncharacterized protein [Anabrus simplex]|uniref:uncharacterized protein n=1 Tax=Anabrus simplex TaxID=316456 RepID=UPI0035A26E2D